MSTKWTNETLKIRFNEIHGEGTYDYSEIDHQGTTKPVTIICRKHGRFQQCPREHFQGSGCQQCSLDKKRAKKGLTKPKIIVTTESCVADFKVLNGDLYDYSEVDYRGNVTPVTIICSKHGKFKQTPAQHRLGSGCPHCAREIRALKRTVPFSRFRASAAKTHGEGTYTYIEDSYKGMESSITIICKVHGEFKQGASSHVAGNGCPRCGIERRSENMTLTKEEFVAQGNTIHGEGTYDYSKVDYKGNGQPVELICKKHGSFWQVAGYHTNGKNGCPRCKTVISKAHKKVIEYLEELGLIRETDFKVNIKGVLQENKKLELDVYFPKIESAIEIDGVLFHGNHENSSTFVDIDKVKARDQLKTELCLKQSISLLRFTDLEIHENWETVSQILNQVFACGN